MPDDLQASINFEKEFIEPPQKDLKFYPKKY